MQVQSISTKSQSSSNSAPWMELANLIALNGISRGRTILYLGTLEHE